MCLAAASEDVEQEIGSRSYLPHPGNIPCVYVWINSSGIVKRPIFPLSVCEKIALYCTDSPGILLDKAEFSFLTSFLLFYFSENKKRDHPPPVRKIPC